MSAASASAPCNCPVRVSSGRRVITTRRSRCCGGPIELGINHIDTAQFYGPNVANELIREALHPYPADLALVSKVGARRDDVGRVAAAQQPDELRAGIEENLRTLGTDRLAAVNLRVHDRTTPTRLPRSRPRAVRPSADRDDQGPRRGAHRRNRAVAASHSTICDSRWTAPRSSACRTPTTSSTGRRSRCSTRASSTASRSCRSSRWVRPSPPTTRCSAIPPSGGGRASSAARQRRSRSRGRCRSRRTCC